jgi:hypothetical protein
MQAYSTGEPHLAYCYHAYLRWNTHHLRPYPALARLNGNLLQELTGPLGIHVLEGSRSRVEGDKRTERNRAVKVLPGYFGRCVLRAEHLDANSPRCF